MKNAIWNLFHDYETCFMKCYAVDNEIDLEEVTEKDVFPMLDDDLSDKGFSKKEIEEISLRQMNKETFYKLSSYMIALFNPASNYNEWKDVIKNDVGIELEENHIKQMWKKYQEIDF